MAAVDHPWQLTEAEWNAERSRLRPNFVQERVTKHCASQAVAGMKRLEWLLFDVHAEPRARLEAARKGEIRISREEADDLLDLIHSPIRYSDVVARAIALGCRFEGHADA